MHPDSVIHLLVVDDDMLLRSMAVKALRHSGFTVSDASHGEEALEKFTVNHYDLVLLDVMMPGLDGYQVCQQIRALPSRSRVPILMLTGLDDTESIQLAYRHGATDFITKPINWTLLSHRVRYALRASDAAESMLHNNQVLERAQRMAHMGTWQAYKGRGMVFSEPLIALFMMPPEVVANAGALQILERVVPQDRDRVRAARERLATAGAPYQIEFQLERYDGAIRTVFEQATLMLDDSAMPIGMEGITQDITERAQAQQQIRLLENFDTVTGLPNRKFFGELCAMPLDWARRNGSQSVMIHVDIDRFKSVNDAFGRDQGDRVLQTVAERLRSWAGRSSVTSVVSSTEPAKGVLARIGGNSFSLLLSNIASQEQASMVALRLLKAISEPITVQEQSVVMSASMGVALFPGDAQALPELIGCAEQAAYAAKAAGRAQHRFFDEHMNAQAARRLLIESDLRRAIGDGELRLHFQPKVDAATRRIVGAEALVRWQHSERGLLAPYEFIPLAEETGLILPLTDWVLESACQRTRQWLDAGLPHVPISVNLAAPSLTDPTLLDTLDALMQRFDLTPDSLTLEVTETMVMGDVEHSVGMLERLRARGYSLSLDDFGTGYSSLSYLKRLTIDELKIDRSFVMECAAGGRDAALAAAIIALGHELGLRIVAEGVETPEQSAFLLRHRCGVQQGYLFARPVAAADFEQHLRRGFMELL